MKKIKYLSILLLLANGIGSSAVFAQSTCPWSDNGYIWSHSVLNQTCGTYTSTSANCSCTTGLQSGTRDATKKRVMWVDDFLTLSNGNTGIVVDQDLTNHTGTILGAGIFDGSTNLYANEKALLTYAKDNHFTSLILYGVSTILLNYNVHYTDGNGTRTTTYAQNLNRFIIAAKTGGWGITEISAVVGGLDGVPAGVHQFNGNLVQPPCFLPNSILQAHLMMASPPPFSYTNYDRSVAAIDLTNRIYSFNLIAAYDSSSIGATATSSSDSSTVITASWVTQRPCNQLGILDRMVTDIDYWLDIDPIQGYLNYQKVINNMNCAKQYNNCPLGVDTYIGSIGDGTVNLTDSYTRQAEITWIDANVDRTYIATDIANPYCQYAYNQCRMNDFNFDYSLSNFPHHSTIYSLFYAKTLMPFLTDHAAGNTVYNITNLVPYYGFNFACVETVYANAFNNDPNNNNYINNISLEGFAWFEYCYLEANLGLGVNPLGRLAEENKTNNDILIIDKGESLQITVGKNCAIRIFDMIGNIVYNATITAGTSTISKVEFANGIYILNAISSNNFVSKKISVIK